jgi:DNA-binding CsgD family transcriptional regulator
MRSAGHPRILANDKIPEIWDSAVPQGTPTISGVDGAQSTRLEARLRDLVADCTDWVSFATAADDLLRPALGFERSCWHSVDPGTVLLTGSVNRWVPCSGPWLAEHEYVLEDVNQFAALARSVAHVSATSIATEGRPERSARYRASVEYGIGDELRGAFVRDGIYWASAAFLRNHDDPCFTDTDVRLLATLSDVIADGARRALLDTTITEVPDAIDGPGVIVFDADGTAEFCTPEAEHLIRLIVEHPRPVNPSDCVVVQAVAARARAAARSGDPLQAAARARVRTHTGSWLLLYGSLLNGKSGDRTAVVIQPAPASEVAPLVALAYGLTGRECAVTRLCIEGRSTKEMADTLHLSTYTVQDHLKAIFAKTGVRTRGELVGQVFLEHYLPRWEDLTDPPPGWHGYSTT